MRLIVTGAAGQLGGDIRIELKKIQANQALENEKSLISSEKISVYPLLKKDLDICEPDAIKRVFSQIKPDIVFNCAAFTDVDGCETQQEKAFLINGDSPGFLAKACSRSGAFLVHFSTDYIFNGKKNEPYSECDRTNPLNIYGSSKLQGEERIREENTSHLIIRTSWLYGARGKNFVKTIIRLAEEGAALKVVIDQVGSPTFSMDLAAKAVESAMAGLTGTYNITNTGYCSWFNIAKEILFLKGLGKVSIEPIKTSDLDRPAKRPPFSALSPQKLTNTGLAPLRDWRSALEDYLKIIDP